MEKLTLLGSLIFGGLALLQPVAAEAVASEVVNGPLPALVSTDFLGDTGSPQTLSQFGREIRTVVEPVLFEIQYQDDPASEWGEEMTASEGKNGQRSKVYEVTSWEGREVSRRLLRETLEPPAPKVIRRGTQIIWRPVPGTELAAWGKLRVWATSYDGNCQGCRGLTYTGTTVKVGVCAVDPKLIPLGTTFYVPGYGVCRAEDIGGAIKGRKVDLGFEDVRRGFWSARYTDIYLLSNAPDR